MMAWVGAIRLGARALLTGAKGTLQLFTPRFWTVSLAFRVVYHTTWLIERYGFISQAKSDKTNFTARHYRRRLPLAWCGGRGERSAEF